MATACSISSRQVQLHKTVPGSSNTVNFSGKPGLGKTFGSVQIIDDLLSHVPENLSHQDKPSVAFFHYSQLDRSKLQTPDIALRAIAEQLIHEKRNNRLTLDALSLIQEDQGSGQRYSSTKDVMGVLDLLLRQHRVFIVVDGVDECHDPQGLLELIRSLCLDHDCRCILLGRPDIRIPNEWYTYQSKICWTVDLDHSIVSDDIARYLEDQFQQFTFRGLFGRRISGVADLLKQTRPDLFLNLASAAEGMFLWGRVLANLLSSPAMSPAARLRSIQQPNELISLDNLYTRILDTLFQANETEQQVAKRLFRWLGVSCMPLTLESFHTALAINVGHKTSELDYLPEYPDCIPRITCSLVEVMRARGTLSFLHVSFKDFLIGRGDFIGSALESERLDNRYSSAIPTPNRIHEARRFNMDSLRGALRPHDGATDDLAPHPTHPRHDSHQQPHRRSGRDVWNYFGFSNLAEIHLELAATCLSYLIYDVPAQPLQSIRQAEPPHGFRIDAASNTLEASQADVDRFQGTRDIDQIRTEYPFLRYSTLCWSSHIGMAHSFLGDLRNSETPWIEILAQFLLNRFRVTTWVEAACMYGLVPRLDRLIPCLAYLGAFSVVPAGQAGAQHREHAWVYLGLLQLTGALKSLSEGHRHALLLNPTLIWQNEITKAVDENFWPNWKNELEIQVDVGPEPLMRNASMKGGHDVPPPPVA